MSLTLSKETEQLVQAEVANSRLNSADDVITEALELYQMRQQYFEGRLEKGIADITAGRFEEYSPQFMDDIKQGALKKIADRKSQK